MRDDFKTYVGDSSLNNTVCDFRLTKAYTRFWTRLWNSNARGELPTTITHQTPVYDTTNLSYYVTIPDTYLAWRFPNNQQIAQEHTGTVWTGNRKIYVKRGKTSQVIECLPSLTYPTTNTAFPSDLLPEIIVLDASERYLSLVARDLEMANTVKAMKTEKLEELNQKYAQQFIYNENDWYEEVKVNLP